MHTLARAGFNIPGFEARFDSTVPKGAGGGADAIRDIYHRLAARAPLFSVPPPA
jgi:hypothetical protein